MDGKPKNKFVETEEKVLAFWNKEKIFQKSLRKEAPKGDFVFYDGPPFATGMPHFGHLLPTTIKDIIPRYKTMRGFRVRRRWGWDCHGLPIENLIEKELGLATKKDIESYGIEKFNEKARESVLRYEKEWREIIPRVGRWVDMENDYKTMDASYTESVWWAFKTLHEKNLLYEGYKSMQICPRCETTLSNFEVGQGYKDVTDISVYVKFELVDEPNTFLLAWTTTPWTLPGNVALAVGENIAYSKVLWQDATYIVAEDRVVEAFAGKEYETTGKVFGRDLVGKEYEPVFEYYDNDTVKNYKNAFKVYAADFVTTTDGTGIVHIAPAFGEDDMKLGQKYDLPFVQHVSMDGVFKPEVKDFAGLHVKPKDDPQKTDIEVLKFLAAHKTLFEKKKIVHPYPHCWRCDTPLLNYAASSWFVKVTDFKDKLVAQNKKVKWVPEEIGQNRFGDWLSNARDWAISRTRFWGAPIPVWRCEDCKRTRVIGSLTDIRKFSKPKNKYIFMRHGESESNVLGLASVKVHNKDDITEKGRRRVVESAKRLSREKIDLIVSSPFVRTKETAEVLAENIGYPKNKIEYDVRLGELNIGIFDGKPWSEYHGFIGTYQDRFIKAPEGGETLFDVRKRMLSTLYELDKKNSGKTIVIVSHEAPLFVLNQAILGVAPRNTVKHGEFLENAEFKKVDFVPMPHDRDFNVDFHRPYIDHIELNCACGGKMKRVPEVFDCWFESGSMPFAEAHYPFETKEFQPKNFFGSKGYPADFIAEGLDQTRGWFYSMIVLGVSLFGKSPYKNVVVNGIVLAEDGSKMSKSKDNFPPLVPIIEKYGADALRYFLASSPAVRAEDVCFSEKGIDEVSKKLLQRLDNVLAFYELYATDISSRDEKQVSENILDRWIIARLSETAALSTEGLEKYEIDKASRPILDFVDDMSNWYIRRSRDRFKSDDEADKKSALMTTRYVLCELSKIMAPFTPFYAEYLFGKVKDDDAKESVHLENWPAFAKPTAADAQLIEGMKETRRLITLGLEARAKAGIKVRQPLSRFETKVAVTASDLMKDELNVKSVKVNPSLPTEIFLDTTITPELREEGSVREFVRAVQELRKSAGLSVVDEVILFVDSDEKGKEFVAKAERELKKVANVAEIKHQNVSETEPIKIEEYLFKLKIIRNKAL